MDQEFRARTEGERVIVGGDQNGHMGMSREAIERIHGDWGVGGKHEEGDRVTYFAIYRSLIHSSRRQQHI